MNGSLQDARYAFRTLAKSPGFALAAIATLALGIGANTAIFSVVHGVLLRPLPYRDAHRLAVVWEDLIREENHRFSVAHANYADLSLRARSFEGLAAQMGRGFLLTGGPRPEAVFGDQVTGNFFSVLGARPALGRVILPDDERQASHVAVVSSGLAVRRFGSAAGALGRTLRVDGLPFAVVGVMSPDFDAPWQLKAPHRPAEIWTPLDLPPSWRDRGTAVLQVVGRLRAGVPFARADAEVGAIARSLAREYPGTNANVGMHLVPLRTQLFGEVRPALLVLAGAVAFVLLVACANVSHLLLARAIGRRREMAIRVALGAGRARLVRPILAESFLLAAAGGAAALAVVWLTTSALVAAAPQEIPRLSGVSPDLAVLAFAVAATAAAAFGAGLLPALRAAGEDPEAALRGEGVASARESGRLRAGLVVSQIAIALLLFSGAALLLETFERLRRFDTGFAAENVVTARLALPRSAYPESAKQLAFFQTLLERLQAAPGVAAAGATTRFPLDPAYGVGSVTFEGAARSAGEEPVVGVRIVGGSYFRAMRIPVLSGRDFDRRDRADGVPSVLVNRTMASRFWPGESPIGRRLAIGRPAQAWRTVVGVVGDVSHDGIDAAPMPEAYLPMVQVPDAAFNLVVRAQTDSRPLPAVLRREVAALDPELPLIELRPMSERIDDALSQPRVLVEAIGGFAALALLLAAVALYALVAQDAERRRREVGIRMTLGALPADVLRLFLARSGRLVAAGVGAGLAAALLLTRLLRPALHGTPPADPAALGAAALILSAIALGATAAAARRATRTDPIEALRND